MNKIIQSHFNRLIKSRLLSFKSTTDVNNISTNLGVYIIYNNKKEVLYIGRTPKAKGGLKQRIKNHLNGASSFSINFAQKNNLDLKKIGKFRYIPIEDYSERAYTEALATGKLCPQYIR